MTDTTKTASADEHTRAFTNALFSTMEPGLHSMFWTRHDKKSTWFDPGDPDAAADLAATLSDDVYVAVSVAASLPAPARLHNSRIASDNSAGIMGFWADVDIADPDIHKKANLPTTQAEAYSLVEKMGLKPSIVVHSGHGLQVWWLFKEFWAFDSTEDRGIATALSQRWSDTMRAHAAAVNQISDSVFDLARVMRVPGTMNMKDPTAPMPVRLLELNDVRYTAEDFEEHCLDDEFLASRGVSSARSYVTGALTLEETASVDSELLETLLEDSRFKKTWAKARTDLADQSGSSYDLSIASQAAALGVPDQEIADLLIQFRRKHKLDVTKALRQDYIARTIARARDNRAREDVADAIEDVTTVIEAAVESGVPEDVDTARRKAMDLIGQLLGLEVVHVYRYSSEPPTFRLQTLAESIDLGGADGVLNPMKFRQAVYQSCGQLIPRFKSAAWDQIADLMSKSWVDQDVGFEATEKGEVYSWISEYLAARPPVASKDEAEEEQLPYVNENGQVVLFSAALKRWLYNSYQERPSNAQMGRKMRHFGAVSGQVPSTSETGGPSRRSTWTLPTDWR